MIKISKSGNSILVEGLDNKFYPDNGKLTFPSNSLILTIDESDMATFRSAANNDVMFSGLIENITISDEAVTKDDIISKFGVIAYSTSGGDGTEAVSSVNGQTGDVVITASSLGAATKSDLDNYATKDELDEKQEVFQVNAPMSFSRDEATQDLHLSIDLNNYATKTELGNVSAEVEHKADKSDVYTMQEVDTKLNGKQNTLTAGTNITISEDNVISVTGGGGESGVTSVNGQTGEVVLDIPTAQVGQDGTSSNYIYSSKNSLNYRSIASQKLVQKGGYTSMEYWYWGQSENEATIMDFPYATSSNGGSMSPSDKTKLDSIPSMSVLTQSEYDALPSKDANTLYFIKE